MLCPTMDTFQVLDRELRKAYGGRGSTSAYMLLYREVRLHGCTPCYTPFSRAQLVHIRRSGCRLVFYFGWVGGLMYAVDGSCRWAVSMLVARARAQIAAVEEDPSSQGLMTNSRAETNAPHASSKGHRPAEETAVL